MIKMMSFGFKHGAPVGSTRMIDCRDMRNPHKLASLRELTGLESDVQTYVQEDPKAEAKLETAATGLKDGDVIAFGCFGGRHRSVALSEILARRLRHAGYAVEVHHKELGVDA